MKKYKKYEKPYYIQEREFLSKAVGAVIVLGLSASAIVWILKLFGIDIR